MINPSLYRFGVFCHVAGVLGLFAALALEWVSLRRLQRSTSYEQAREWSSLWSLLLPIGLPAVLAVLASGIYLATTVGAWELGWVKVAVPTFVLVAIAGAVVGPRRKRLQADLAEKKGSLPVEMRLRFRDPLFITSLRCRAALLLSLVFVMTNRPESALLTIASFGAVGVLASVPAWRARADS
jgi:hypothetical protein